MSNGDHICTLQLCHLFYNDVPMAKTLVKRESEILILKSIICPQN